MKNLFICIIALFVTLETQAQELRIYSLYKTENEYIDSIVTAKFLRTKYAKIHKLKKADIFADHIFYFTFIAPLNPTCYDDLIAHNAPFTSDFFMAYPYWGSYPVDSPKKLRKLARNHETYGLFNETHPHLSWVSVGDTLFIYDIGTDRFLKPNALLEFYIRIKQEREYEQYFFVGRGPHYNMFATRGKNVFCIGSLEREYSNFIVPCDQFFYIENWKQAAEILSFPNREYPREQRLLRTKDLPIAYCPNLNNVGKKIVSEKKYRCGKMKGRIGYLSYRGWSTPINHEK